MTARFRFFATAAVMAAALAGCRGTGDLVVDEGVGVTALRSACPAVGVPDYTGDVTLFRTPGATTADNIDLVAQVTNVRSQCDEAGDKVHSTITFDVQAQRYDAGSARQVTLPYFVTVLRGGTAVITKRVGSVTLDFPAGQARAQARGQGSSTIDKAEATLPQDVRDKLTRKRRAGDADAAVDPLSQPDVKAAVARSTFEVLVGFQLDQTQLTYNATR